ncbi:MAG: putative hydro-lyase [Treponema sp.]|jgi:uncharacterized protein YcsI (UPF0317 family)|nr:putative hydro-lyase [Treponema sp.]
MKDYTTMSPREARALIREGSYTRQTSGMCGGYAQANLAVLPAEYAYDFLLFTQRNPKSCPVLEVSDKGSRLLKFIAPEADIARDIPQYRIYRKGVLQGEYTDVAEFWQDDFVSFLIGCSFSFESELLASDVPVRHIEEDRNVPMYITSIDCVPAGMFHGKMVVSMRPLPPDQVIRAVNITASMPRVHGAPVHIGDPGGIGIKDINTPDFGDRVTIHPGEVPVFWACGVTPQSVVMSAKPSIAITHAPGHMLITDVKNTVLKF